MSKVAPHNATTQIRYDAGGRKYVYKKYHAKYTSREEFLAYQRLGKCLLRSDSGVRAAEIYEVNDLDNSLNIEFINHQTLHEMLFTGKVYILELIQEKLLDIFHEAKRQNVNFDSDPSNLFCDESGSEIVIIDPVGPNLSLNDYAMVVFVWGLIKLSLRNPRLWQSYRVLIYCFDYYCRYMDKTRTDYKSFNRQMSEYIGVVIGWNKEKNLVEGIFTRIFRRIVVVPLYSIVKLFFSTNLVRH